MADSWTCEGGPPGPVEAARMVTEHELAVLATKAGPEGPLRHAATRVVAVLRFATRPGGDLPGDYAEWAADALSAALEAERTPAPTVVEAEPFFPDDEAEHHRWTTANLDKWTQAQPRRRWQRLRRSQP